MKEKGILYGQNLESSDIFMYLPDSFKMRLSKREIKYIKDAFSKAVLYYQKRYEQNYLDKMLI
jgi:hypothetical protein